MPLCALNPALPIIGIMLSGLALLATLKLLLRLMSLETAQDILQEVAEIDDLRGTYVNDDAAAGPVMDATDGGISARRLRAMTRRQYVRLLLLAPSVALLLGCSTLLYQTTVDDCDFPDWDEFIPAAS